VNHVTVQKWLKKAESLADFKTTIEPGPKDAILETGETFQ